MTGTPRAYSGSCHCGAIGFEFRLARPPAEWSVRRCDCSFCVAHAATYTSDPGAELRFRCGDPAQVNRYRFGQRTADFILCASCGVLLGAIMQADEDEYAVINLHAMIDPPAELPSPDVVCYAEESVQERLSRRQRRWAPVVQGL
jgi:hypothetical protein